MVQVNCSAVVHLTRLYLAEMVQRRAGDVLIVASTAAFQPVPYISTYAATKAFDLLFAEGLAEEVRTYGVRVCALCPGSTESEFRRVANQTQVPGYNRKKGARRESCQNRIAGTSGGKELCHLRSRKLSRPPCRAARPPPHRRANRRQDVPPAREALRRFWQ